MFHPVFCWFWWSRKSKEQAEFVFDLLGWKEMPMSRRKLIQSHVVSLVPSFQSLKIIPFPSLNPPKPLNSLAPHLYTHQIAPCSAAAPGDGSQLTFQDLSHVTWRVAKLAKSLPDIDSAAQSSAAALSKVEPAAASMSEITAVLWSMASLSVEVWYLWGKPGQVTLEYLEYQDPN